MSSPGDDLKISVICLNTSCHYFGCRGDRLWSIHLWTWRRATESMSFIHCSYLLSLLNDSAGTLLSTTIC